MHNKTKILFSGLFLSIILSSCFNYKMQVISLACDNMTKSDTVWIKKDAVASIGYYFYGKNGNTLVFIANKSDKPIFFDKKNSFISSGNYKQDFWNDVSQFNGSLTFKQYRSITLKTNNPINGTVTKADRIDMIAPNSILVFDPKIYLRDSIFDLNNYKCKTDIVKANWTNKTNKNTIVKSVDFYKENSPSLFRYFITLSRTEDFKNPEYFDFNFWVDNIMEMNIRQGTKAANPQHCTSGLYNVDQKTEMDQYHPYKKSWRYYITELN